MSNCGNKKRFASKKAAEDYIRFGVFEDNGLEPYECKPHKCWHMGHPKDYSDNPVARINILLDRLSEEN